MAYVRQLTCLTASRKKNQLCFAGKDTANDEWIRPVTTHGEHEVSVAEATNSAGALTRVGDVVTIAFRRHEPFAFQHENHLIDPGVRWIKDGTADWPTIAALVDHPARLWDSGDASRGYDNNRVAEDVANSYEHSLYLIRPENLTVSVARKGGVFDDANIRLVKARFRYAGTDYILRVTDPSIERLMLDGVDRTEPFDDALLCISLTGAYLGHAYKLVAAIIQPH